MLYLPPLRRALLPSLLFLALILYYKSTVRLPTARQQLSRMIVRQPELSPPGTRISIANIVDNDQVYIRNKNVSENFQLPPIRTYYHYNELSTTFDNGTEIELVYEEPDHNPHMAPLWQCPTRPNNVTHHIRLPNLVHNISVVVFNDTENERKGYLNPAILSLPYWSTNQYLLVSRVDTDGSHQENLICEANICYTGDEANARPGEKPCDPGDLALLGGSMGMRCATTPVTLNVPPTPAENCGAHTGPLMDIPGFHDPRIFWSGKGEPLMMVNSQSRYACFGLWLIDLRRLHDGLEQLVASNPFKPSLGPLMSYGSLTELTRNPPNTRGSIEKNWMIFGDKAHGSYVHYDMGPQKRSFAKLLGGGLSTDNLTDPREIPCLEDAGNPSEEGTWHQATNSLKLVLCDRADKDCAPTRANQVFFSLIHHKHKNVFTLPLRYERYLMVWSAEPPFNMLGISKHPMLLYNETASGFDAEENWVDDHEQTRLLADGKDGKPNWAYFTYTVSLAWAWGRKMDEPEDKGKGYLDDDVIMGIGVDDGHMAFSRVLAKDLLQCLRACPGRRPPGAAMTGPGTGAGYNAASATVELVTNTREAIASSVSSEEEAVAEMQATGIVLANGTTEFNGTLEDIASSVVHALETGRAGTGEGRSSSLSAATSLGSSTARPVSTGSASSASPLLSGSSAFGPSLSSSSASTSSASSPSQSGSSTSSSSSSST